MRFRKLRLAGFKSFVDPAELRIEDGLTGVVGPNGCGKSNLLEAIRWVMGESSPKSLRGGGMEDVIFAGTSVRPSRDFADVTLLLDNSARTAPAQFNDGDEIEVMRRIERGLGSAYRINGRDVRQKDVQLLFADAATGAHSPALVSQGRIGAIIAAKPQERRAMLEEAAGIAGLHVRRKDAEQRLRAAEANLARLDDVLQNMEAQAASLKRQARQAERYRTLTDRIGAVEARLLHARWRAAAEAAKAARASAAEIEAKLAAVSRASAELSARQANAAADLPALRQAEAEAAAALQALNQAAQALTAELAGVERRQRELDSSAQTVARDRDREVSIAADAGEALERLAGEAAALEARLAGARESLAAMAAKVAAAEQQASAHERELAERMAAQADA
ncbi:MAG: AAA family ATPase, partial [Alphaproteobacteria bacterium]|nr:AAA family ATPase [Alphaproteobacteria bacterium]